MNLLKKIELKLSLTLFTLFLLNACSPQHENNTSANTENARAAQCLALQSQCQFDLISGRVEVLFDVEKIIAEQSFNMVVNYHGTETLTRVSGYLEGVDMFMGKIPLFIEERLSGGLKENSKENLKVSLEGNSKGNLEEHLAEHSKNNLASNKQFIDTKPLAQKQALLIHDKAQVFQGEVLVGSCSAEQMTWRIWLTFTTSENKTYNKTFTVESYRI